MRIYFTIACCLISYLYCFSQVNDDEIVDALIDELLLDQNVKFDEYHLSLSNFNLLYTSLNYNSNTYFTGREIGYNQYNVVPQVTYVSSKGIYGGISGTYFSEFYPKWDFTVAFLGYGRSFGKDQIANYTISFSKYFYANNEDDFFGNTIDVGLGLRSKNKKISTQLIYTYLFGNEQSFQVASKNYVSFNLTQRNNYSLKLRPQLNIIYGKQTIETPTVTIIHGFETIVYSKKNILDFMNTQFKFPLQYSYKNLDIELGYTINFPNAIDNETSLNSTDFFNVTIGYLIAL